MPNTIFYLLIGCGRILCGFNQCFPKFNCDLLITSRCKLLDEDMNITVGFLELEYGIKLFNKHYTINKDDEAAKEIIKLAGRHTMTIELLAKTAQAGNLNLLEFIEKLEKQGFDLTDINEEIATEWDDKKTQKKLVKHLQKLFVISALPDEEKRLLEQLSLIATAPIKINDVRDILNLKSLNQLNKLIEKGWLMSETDSVQMHTIIKAMTEKQYKLKINNCLFIIENIANKLKWDVNKCYVDVLQYHQLAIEVFTKFFEYKKKKIGILAHNIARVYVDKGEYDKALEYYEKALEIIKKVHGEEHASTGTIYNNMAGVFESKGEYDTALKYNEKALVICKKVYGEEHPGTGVTYNNIAGIFRAKGEYDKALDLCIKACSILLKFLSSQHPNMQIVLSNTKGAYIESGRPENKFNEWLDNKLQEYDNG